MRAVVAAVVALGGLVAAAEFTGTTAQPASSAAAAVSVPVTDATVVCPDVSGAPGSTATTATLADVAGALRPPSQATGTVTARSLAGVKARPVAIHPSPIAALHSRPGLGQALAMSAHGSVAASLVVDQVSEIPSGRYRALTGLRCDPPATDWWFAGADGRVGYTDSLILGNPSPTRVLVSVSLLSASGPLSPPHLADLPVPADTRVLVSMATVAPDAATLAVHVHAVSGSVTAALIDRRTTGLQPGGSDYLPATRAPHRDQVVPGYPAGPGTRLVVIANPGSADATVNLRLVTGAGSFAPAGHAQLVVPAGHTATADVTQPMSGGTGAVELRSNQPIVAQGMSVIPARHKLPDLAWQPAQPPLVGTGAVANGVDPDGGHCVLLLTAPAAAALVRVTSTAGHSTSVTVPAGRSVAADITGLLGRGPTPVGFTVIPTGGPVYATRVLSFAGAHGSLATAEPVLALPRSLRLPAVREDPRIGVR